MNGLLHVSASQTENTTNKVALLSLARATRHMPALPKYYSPPDIDVTYITVPKYVVLNAAPENNFKNKYENYCI